MRRRKAILGAALVGLVLLVAGVQFAIPAPHGIEPAVVETPVGVLPSGPLGEANGGPDSEVRRLDQPAAAAVVGAAIDRVETRLTGRCIAHESGRPLEACEVSVRTPDGDTLAESESGTDGRFALVVFRRPGGRQHDRRRDDLLFEVRAPGRVSLGGRQTVGSRAVFDLGELVLRRGSRVRGQLRDVRGRAVAGASIWLTPLRAFDNGILSEPWPSPGVTDRHGRFELAVLVSSGPQRISLRDAPALQSDGEIVIATPGAAAGSEFGTAAGAVVELVLTCAVFDVRDQIRGTVFDQGGRAVPNAVIQARSPRRPANSVAANSNGVFTLFRPSWIKRSALLSLTVFERSTSRSHDIAGEFAWGRQDVRLVLGRGHDLRISVRSDGGRPVTEFAVQCLPLVGMRTRRDSRLRGEGTHRYGQVVLSGLRSGRHLVVVHPRGAFAERLSSTLPQEVLVRKDLVTELSVELPARVIQTVRVTFADGRGVAGSEIELFALWGTDQLLDSTFRTPLSRFMMGQSTRHVFAVSVAKARTDARGVARLSCGTPIGALSVQVRGQHVLWRRDGVSFSRVDPLVVVVEKGAGFSGRVGPPELLKFVHHRSMPGELLLVAKDGGREAKVVPIDEHGEFKAAAVPAGRYEIYLRRRAVRGGLEEIPGPLATIVLSGVEKRSLTLDLRGIVELAGLTGTLLDSSGPVVGARVRLLYPGRGGGLYTAARGQTDASGGFTFASLTARDYQLRVHRGRWVRLPDQVTLVAGQVGSLTAELPEAVSGKPGRMP